MDTRDFAAWQRRPAMAGADQDQIKIVATSSRFWRLGDLIKPGQVVGETIHGAPVQVTAAGWITDVQYDVETDEVILSVESICDGDHESAWRAELVGSKSSR